MRLRFVLEALDRVSGPMRDIIGGTNRAAKSLKETRDALRGLEDQQKQIDGYKRQQSSLAEQSERLDAARTKQELLAAQIAATAKPTKKLQNEYEKTTREVNRFEDGAMHQTETLKRLQTELTDAGVDVSKLAQHETELNTKIKRTSETMREQQARIERAADARRKFDQRSQMAQKIGMSGAATLGAGVAVGMPLKSAIEEARAYQSVMTDIAQKSDMSREAARKLGVQLLAIAKDTNQYSDDIQRGMDALTGQGLDATTAAKMMEPLGKAATAYKADLKDLSQASYAVYSNLQVPVNQVAKALDVMAQGGKAGAFELKDMAQFFPALAASYAGLKQQGVGAVADLTAALEIATKGAGSAAEGANNVQNLINKINSRETVQNFAKFGIDLPKALKKAAAEGKTPIEAIALLTQKALGGNTEKLGYLFNDMQVQAALRPLMQHMDDFKKIRADALKANGTVNRDFADRMKDEAEKAKQAEIAVKNLAITTGNLLLPTMTALDEKITKIANKLAAWAAKHPGLAKGIALVTAGITGLLVVLGLLGLGIAGGVTAFGGLSFGMTKCGPLFKRMAGGFGEVVMAVKNASTFLMANPIYLAIAAIALAAYLIYDNWGTIGPWLANLWKGIKNIFSDGVAFISQIPQRMANIGTAIVQGIGQGIESAKAWLMGKLTALANMIPAPVKAALGIHSPSRVFAGLGGHIMAGLDQGVENGAAAPLARLGKLSRQMAGAMAAGALIVPSVAPAADLGGGPFGGAVHSPAMVMAGRNAPLSGAGDAAKGGVAGAATNGGVTVTRHYNITIKTMSGDAGEMARAVKAAIAQIENDRKGRAYEDD